jgi:DNA sulfur modification protein DndD
MILKELVINNFRSYYKESVFTFKDGLTLIIGGNGDGKTTFFDALEWLFSTDRENKSSGLISEKRKAEMIEGDIDSVIVYLEFEHNGIKTIEKKFRFEKQKNGEVITYDFSFQGWDGVGSEREMIKGSILLEQCFDATIRKYCLFKGESNLNVFDNEAALKTLVDKFSNIRQFDDYVELVARFEQKADEAYKKELRNDDKVSAKARLIESKSNDVKRRIADIKNDIKHQEYNSNLYGKKIEDIEHYKETSEKYNEIKNRITTLSGNLTRVRSLINEEYNIKLLDDLWILVAFPDLLNEYRMKVSSIGKEKRKLEKEHIEKLAKEKGKQEAIEEMKAIANGATPLPWYLPDDQTMQEMIDEHICKVCGRDAEEGSEAHNFMKEKLAQYMRNMEAKNMPDDKDKDKPLFPKSYIDELNNLGISLSGNRAKEISALRIDIKERIELNAARKIDVQEIERQIKEAENEKARLLIQSDGVSEEVLEASFSDLKGYFEQKSRAEKKLFDLQVNLNTLLDEEREVKREYEELNPSGGLVKIYSKVHMTFDKILKSFERAKKSNLHKFLKDLEENANHYLKSLNVDDFHGIVKIIETANESARIQLRSSNGADIDNPNGALQTTMYMSVLFAISDLTTLKRDEDYPLIFDAPTSSFESFKEEEFYNVIDKINKQCIIVTKDLLDKDDLSGERRLNDKKIEQLTCSVYRIEKKRPFDPNDLSTICTTSKPIK